jgi:hypothetical protein
MHLQHIMNLCICQYGIAQLMDAPSLKIAIELAPARASSGRFA